MRRRDFLAAPLSLALAPAARAQGRLRTIGYLSSGADTGELSRLLAERGLVEGRHIRFELRVAPADPKAHLEAAAELVRLRPDVLVAFGGLNVGALAERTKVIPIVCGGLADPVGQGFAASLRRPGGNVTGLSFGIPEFAEILVSLHRAIRPGLRRAWTIVPRVRGDEVKGWAPGQRSVVAAAGRQGVSWEIRPVAGLADLEQALAAIGDPHKVSVHFQSLDEGITSKAALLARRQKLASSAADPEMVREGALMHYALVHRDRMRRVAAILDQVLRGGNPAEIPFELPDRTTFILNRSTAKAIGVDLPVEVLARATEILDY
jgi:putative ABC transport system substrate-binding protein